MIRSSFDEPMKVGGGGGLLAMALGSVVAMMDEHLNKKKLHWTGDTLFPCIGELEQRVLCWLARSF